MAKSKGAAKNIEIQPKYGSCTPDTCFFSDIIKDNDVLQCKKCDRFVHYACSELPTYQIQICLQYRQRSFQCANCVEITPILLEKMKTSKQRVAKQEQRQNEEKHRLVNEKLDNIEKKLEKLITKEDTNKEAKCSTYAEITKEAMKKQEVTINNFIKEAKEDKEEERWMNSTKNNIIVHNLGENKHEDREEQLKGDKDYVEEVVKGRMKFNVNIVKVERIGPRKDEIYKTEKWRPLKVTLANEEDKKRIMASAHKLKDEFRITDDFSRKERETIKLWHQKAKEKTSNEGNQSFIWKVRGSPRTKLYLKKFSNAVTENSTCN